MAEIWKPQSISIYNDWIQAIIDESSDILNNWETSFIESLTVRLDNENNLTELQAQKLELIYCEKTK